MEGTSACLSPPQTTGISAFHTPATRINNSRPFCELEPLSVHSPSGTGPCQGAQHHLLPLAELRHRCVQRGIRAQLLRNRPPRARQSVSVRNTNHPSGYFRYLIRISLINVYFHPSQGWKSLSRCQISAANPILTISQGREGTSFAIMLFFSSSKGFGMTI